MSFPECDYFCLHVGRVSIVPSNCDSAEDFFARDCQCDESPVKQNAACLQSICTPQQFNDIVAAEVARCGSSVTSTSANPEATLTARRTIARREMLTVQADDAVPMDNVARPLYRLPGTDAAVSLPLIVLALFGVVVPVTFYMHRRARRTLQIK
ncbi:hypothetical protein C8Q77DRAFT_1162223 [Trametes polyzona]|nr:hypothetical protein C8Q77DRAFT_1162223 [Trametes polyzona]